jgi:hypothetical protein
MVANVARWRSSVVCDPNAEHPGLKVRLQAGVFETASSGRGYGTPLHVATLPSQPTTGFTPL